MRLIDDLRAALADEASVFRQILIREDIGRLEAMARMAAAESDRALFVAEALKLEWTPDNRRTHELKPALVPLMEAVHGAVRGTGGADDALIGRLWADVEALRMDRLVGCLSRVPRPVD